MRSGGGWCTSGWRAIAWRPDEVAAWADWPLNETDLHARHRWLVEHGPELRRALDGDPLFFDAKVAGWWLWGIAQWIGSGWCSRPEWKGRTHAGSNPRGILTRLGSRNGLLNRKRPWLGGPGQWMEALALRLRRVRVCYGDWKRVLTPSVTDKVGGAMLTGVFLDPPYDLRLIRGVEHGSDGAAPSDALYNHHDNDLSAEVWRWAVAHGDNPLLRIALCGYEGEHVMPAGWECAEWKASGGYGNSGKGAGRANAERERIWFSPACLKTQQGVLFGE